MKKILLVSFYNDEAYGLRILHSILTAKGHHTTMLFLKLYGKQEPLTKIEEDLFINFLTKHKFDIVGFSLVSPNWMLYKRLYPRIRNAGNFKIILGGWQPTLNPYGCIDYGDVICRGEGEKIIFQTVEDTIEGIIESPLLTNISYPLPLFDDKYSYYIESDKIVYKDPYKENTRYGTMIGRGCPYSCTYCSNSFMKNIYPRWSKIRYRNVMEVINELSIAKGTLSKLERINFYDEVFIPPKEWVKDFFIYYKLFVDLPFYCMFYPGTCNESLIEMLKDAGLKGVWLGIQSGSERVREEVFKRYYSNDEVYRQVDLFHRYGISVKYDFIFDNPFESPKETQETIQMMAKLPEPKSFNLFSLKFFPNTEITKMALERKLITQEQIDDQLNIDNPIYTVSEEKEREILEKVKNV